MTSGSFVVSVEDAGTRVDLFLTHRYPQESRSAIQKWFEKGAILVNRLSVKPSYKLHTGDQIEVMSEPSDPHAGENEQLIPWDFPLEILYEDDSFLAVNKPPHTVVHPGAGSSQHTIAHAAVHYLPSLRNVGHPQRPGIVHRLDKETSGVLLLAKTQAAYFQFTAIFKNRQIRKHYRAAVFGVVKAGHGRIEKALGRDPLNRQKISVRARKSRAAITLYDVMRQLPFGALLDVEILTGRTHQIRVHLSSENHPIIGDAKYGGANWNRIPDTTLRNQLTQGGFFGLHAFSLEFNHPDTGVPLRLEAPVPPSWNWLQNAVM
jgi:23S rRNA pseudouridine1911/1915/1917 synthase